jgi:uncharacterized OsmC-like protein
MTLAVEAPALAGGERVRVGLRQREGYEFEVDFGEPVPALRVDEPPPLGRSAGPSPVQLLAAAAGNCLVDSLLFALRDKYKQQPGRMGCEVTAEVGRNPQGRLRVLAIDVVLTLGVPATTLKHLERALDQFEAHCTVSQSISAAVPVRVQVIDSEGRRLN